MTMTTPPRPTGAQRRRGVILAVLPAVVVAAAGTAMLSAVRSSLPDPLATHWGTDGVDGFASFSATVWTSAALVVGVPVLLAVLGWRREADSGWFFTGLATGTAVFLGAVAYGASWSQRGLADAAAAPEPGPWIAVGAVAGIGLGVLAGRASRPPRAPLPTVPVPLPEGAPHRVLPPQARLAWFGRIAPNPSMIVVVLASCALVGYLAAVVTPWLWALALFLAVVTAATLQATVVIDGRGVRVNSLGSITWSRVPLERVTSASTRQVSAMREFGGYGWRLGKKGSQGFITRSGEALVVHRAGEGDLLLTVEDPSDAATAVNTLLAQRGR